MNLTVTIKCQVTILLLPLWLMVELHCEGDGVENDGEEHRVLTQRRCSKRPQLILQQHPSNSSWIDTRKNR